MVRAAVAQGSHRSSILVTGADLQPFQNTVTCDLRCCFAQNPTSLILGLTIHKRLPQPRSGTPHAHNRCCCGGQGSRASLLAPPASPESWDLHGSIRGLALAPVRCQKGAELRHCLVLPHQLSARFKLRSLVLPLKASCHCPGLSEECPLLWGRKGREKRFCAPLLG